jgi:NADH-quinone oxidoreductase subunit H
MTIFWRYAITIFLYPGGLFALLAGWLLLALGAQLAARLRGTPAPRLTQPAHDFLKLLGKTTSLPKGAESGVLRVLPLLAVVTPLLAIILLPLPGNLAASTAETSGDLLAVLFLLLLPALMPFFLGMVQASPYARLAAQRALPRSILLMALTLLSALAAAAERRALTLSALAAPQAHPTTASIVLDLLAGLLFWLCLPALLPPARWRQLSGDPALLAGPYTDLAGADLALLQLSAALQRIATASFLAVVFILPFAPDNPALQIIIYLATLLISALWAAIAAGLIQRRRRYSFAR